MSDRRNRYRAVSRMENEGEFWKVQVRRWWWPLWTTVNAYKSSIDRARECAMNHARKKFYFRRVVEFGRFPEGNR